MEPLDFGSIEVQEQEVIGPDKKRYILREANGKAAREHRNALLASTQFGPDGKGGFRVTGLQDLASVEAKLVAACLFDENGKNLHYQTVEGWPARVQKTLYEHAKELSDLGEDDILGDKLKKALKRDDCPIDYEDFVQWAKSLEESDSELSRISRLFDEEDESKN